MTEFFATITSMSIHESGTLGGQELTITGIGFDPNCAQNSVLLGGVPCVPSVCSNTSIVCRIGALPAGLNGSLTSTTGLIAKFWWNAQAIYSAQAFTTNPRYPAQPDVTTLAFDGLVSARNNFADLYLQQVWHMHCLFCFV